MIKYALQLCHQIDTFCAVNQCFIKKSRDKNHDDRSIYHNILTSDEWEILKEIYCLTRHFYNFITQIERYITTGTYNTV